jgi:DNA-binding PadR family transcriptional regulator
MKEDLDQYLPLSPATLHILLALAAGDLHGYGIMQEIARQSEDRYRMGPGTLYDNLQRLTAQGMVTEVDCVSQDDSRRRCYRLTSLGRGVLRAEVARLEGVILHAKLHLQTAKPRRS